MQLSENGYNFLVSQEGLKLTAYKCQAGIWTIGVGHTKNVKQGDVITNTQAHKLFDEDSEWVERAVNRSGLVLNQNQFDALFSLIFNIGEPNFKASTLYRLLKEDVKRKDIEMAWCRWNKARINGELQISKGLDTRRKKEVELFFKL